jgi:hypothetical protein
MAERFEGTTKLRACGARYVCKLRAIRDAGLGRSATSIAVEKGYERLASPKQLVTGAKEPPVTNPSTREPMLCSTLHLATAGDVRPSRERW